MTPRFDPQQHEEQVLTRKTTWAGLTPETHARREIHKAKALKEWPEGSDPEYRLKIADDDIDSETGLLYDGAGFDHPRKAAVYTLTHFPREYGYGLYEVRPITNVPG